MRFKHFTFILMCISGMAFAQTTVETIQGRVTFISSQNVYVKFDNTAGINIGDTLFVMKNDKTIPVLVVANLSTISCVGSPLVPNLAVSTSIIAKKSIERTHKKEIENDKSRISTPINDALIVAATKKMEENKQHEQFYGRFSASSYSNTSSYTNNHRLRYNLSFNAQHIANSKFSAESYIAFTHKPTESIDINNALRIYNLSVKYELNKTSTISLGRKININMANIGAVDGLQYEKTSNNFIFGALIGTRPDYTNYSFNADLLQFGGFVGHSIKNKNGIMQTSLGVFNQMNNFKTDRRYSYFQHSNSLLKNVDVFCSLEVDLYSLTNNQPTTTFDLTGAYASVRYTPWRNLSMSLSYDARKNIYYYETFKNQIDSILDKETRQGYRFQTMYRPFKKLIWGTNAGYRFHKSDSVPSMNANTYLTYTQLPFVKVALSINATILKSRYTDGTMFGGSLSRDFFSGKLYSELSYRYVNYSFNNSDFPLIQNIAELNLSWRVAKKTTLSVDFEATKETDNNFGSLYINISHRF